MHRVIQLDCRLGGQLGQPDAQVHEAVRLDR